MLFEFVRDTSLRSALKTDYADLRRCVVSGAVVPTLILAATISERLLVDLLVSAEPERFTGESLAAIQLSELFDLCHERGLVPTRVRTWAVVLLDYQVLLDRNAAKRSMVILDQTSARLALDIVDTIAAAAFDRFVDRVGLSAQELEGHLATGDSVDALVAANGGRVDDDVLLSLLTDVLPRRAQQAVEAYGAPSPQLARISEMVDVLFAVAPEEIRTTVVETLIRLLDREPERMTAAFEAALLRGRSFQYAGSQREPARGWLQRRFLSPIHPLVLERLTGIAAILFPDDIGTVVDAIIQAEFLNPGADRRASLLEFFKRECFGLSADQTEAVLVRVEGWFSRIDIESGGDYAQLLTQMMTIAAIMQMPEPNG